MQISAGMGALKSASNQSAIKPLFTENPYEAEEGLE